MALLLPTTLYVNMHIPSVLFMYQPFYFWHDVFDGDVLFENTYNV